MTALSISSTGKDKVKNELLVISGGRFQHASGGISTKKGSLFLNTLAASSTTTMFCLLLRNYYQHFNDCMIMTTDMVAFFNQRTGLQLRLDLDEYFAHAAIPTLELRF